MSSWPARIAFAGTVAFSVAGVAVSAAQDWPTGSSPFIYGTLATVFATVGWMIAERRPENRIGPILLLFGLGWAAYLPADALLRLPDPIPGSAFIAATVQCLDVTSFTLLALALLFFPDGRSYSPRWRWVVPAGVLFIAMDILGVWLDTAPVILFPSYRSPFGLAGFPAQALVLLSYAGMLVLYVLAVISLVRRWRRGGSVERTQIKWIGAAAAVAMVGEVINVLTFDPADPNGLLAILASFTITLVPIAIGVAILRYRLYEIDRLISRTIAYATVSAILASVFVAIILMLQAVLAPFTQGQTIAVAASTLVVFALFQPVRRRVQHAVDRRFDRARIDADLTSAAFAQRLRDEVDIETVAGDLRRTVRTTVKPSSIGLWLREADR